MRYSIFSVYTDGTFSINIGWNFKKLAQYDPQYSEKYRALVKKELNLEFAQSVWEQGFPKASLKDLKWDVFRKLIDQFVRDLNRSIFRFDPFKTLSQTK